MLGVPPEDAADHDPHERLRLIVGHLESNRGHMHCEQDRHEEVKKEERS